LGKVTLLLASVSFGVLLASAAAVLTAEPGAGQTATVTLVGAGDISRCDNTHDTATARLVASIPGTVFTAGDNAYKEGSLYQFRHCYAPTWGRFKARTKPSVGNHEYRTPGRMGTSTTLGRRPAIGARATTPTTAAPGTSSCSTRCARM
jgi:hypothetical protein